MNIFSKKPQGYLSFGLFVWVLMAVVSIPSYGNATLMNSSSPDRAVQIAKKSRSRVERSGNEVKVSSQALFQEFSDRTVALQELLDTRKQLESAGMLDKDDPEGKARRAHLNGNPFTVTGSFRCVGGSFSG